MLATTSTSKVKIVVLAETLDMIVADDSIVKTRYLTDGVHEELHWLIQLAVELADAVLVTYQGGFNYDSVRSLKEMGYCVMGGERDSFGYLSHIIMTPKGQIVYSC